MLNNKQSIRSDKLLLSAVSVPWMVLTPSAKAYN